MELARYRPGEAIRWLRTGAESIRKDAQARGRTAMRSNVDAKAIGESIRNAAGAVMDYGRGTYADLVHRQAEASEYVLQDDHLDIVTQSSVKTIPYERVEAIQVKGDRATLVLDRGTVTVKPFAHILAGRVRVPVGWTRNGIEVPYELLIDEIAARCKLDVSDEA